MDRIRFIAHQGKRILLVDLTNSRAKELAAVSKLVPSYVTAEPRNSELLLADFTGAQFDREALEVIKKGTVFDRPHLKRSAWVGTDSIPKAFFDAIKTFSLRQLPAFTTRDEALDYLAEQEPQKLASPA